MARVKLEVNRELLVSSIKEAEKNGPLSNQNALWNAVADLYNVRAAHTISFSVVALRVKEWGLSVLTQPGQKGRPAGVPLSDEQKAAMQAGRVGRRERLLGNEEISEVYDDLIKESPERYHPVINRAREGSRTALLKVICLDCTCFQPGEIAGCTAKCPLRPFRAYRNQKDVDSDTGSSEQEEEQAEIAA